MTEREYLKQLAAIRRDALKQRRARVLELHAQRLPATLIARRLTAGQDWVRGVIRAAGMTPLSPKDADTEGVAVP